MTHREEVVLHRDRLERLRRLLLLYETHVEIAEFAVETEPPKLEVAMDGLRSIATCFKDPDAEGVR